MSILIIEDEAVAARTLIKLLADLAPECSVEGPLTSVDASLQRLQQGPAPELILLDVQLSDGVCFELFDVLPMTTPVIFTTAYDQFALRAFEVHGIDYLLKPIAPQRLALALAKWRRLRAQGQTQSLPSGELAQSYFSGAQQYRERFLVQLGSVMQSIPTSEVAYFYLDQVVRLIDRSGRAYTVSQSLEELEGMLPPLRFFRLNRQLLAQIDAVQRVHRGSRGKLDVELRPVLDQIVSVSAERAAAFKQWLGL